MINHKAIIKSSVLFWVVIGALWALGVSQVPDYGITSDESLHIRNVRWAQDQIISNEQIPGDLRFYGVAFDMFAEGVYRFRYRLLKGHAAPEIGSFVYQNPDALRKRIRNKHYVTFALSIAAIAATGLLVGMLTKPQWSIFGVGMLVMCPMYWGHSFYNPKDIPFASFFTLSTFVGALLLKELEIAAQSGKWRNKSYLFSLFFGVLAGLATGVRIGGVVLPVFMGVAMVVACFRKEHTRKELLRLAQLFFVLVCSWYAVTVLCYPGYWHAPWRLLSESIQYQAHHAWAGVVLFDSQLLSGRDVPWYYIPQWLALTVPPFLLILAVAGLYYFIKTFSAYSASKRGIVVLVLLQLFALPVLAILQKSTLYDGIRHFLFIFPALSIIASYGLILLWQNLRGVLARVLLGVAVLVQCVNTFSSMYELHPYEALYFNEFGQDYASIYERYDGDYWGVSIKDAVHWLDSYGTARWPVVVCGHYDATMLAARMPFKFVDYAGVETKPYDVAPNFYYIGLLHKGSILKGRYPNCKVVHEVGRKGAVYTVIKRCSKVQGK